MSIVAWHDPGLNIMFFFARSLRIQILFERILILSMASVFASSSTTSVCEIVSVISSLFENSIFFHVRSNLTKLSGACCRFIGTFRTVLYSCPILLYYLRFHEAKHVCARRGMLLLLLALPILFQRYLRWWSWCFKPCVMWNFFSNTLNFASLCIIKLPCAWFGEDINISTSSGSTLAMIRLTTAVGMFSLSSFSKANL